MMFFKKKNYKLKLRNFLEAMEFKYIDNMLDKDPEFFTALGNETKKHTKRLISKIQRQDISNGT